MNRRGRRLALTVAATGLAVLIGLAVLHWGTVRDHVEAWHFQLTRETVTMEPNPNLIGAWTGAGRTELFVAAKCFRMLAAHSGLPLIVERAQSNSLTVSRAGPLVWDASGVTTDALRKFLELAGYRVLEQRFPRRAYVVIRDERDKVEQPAPPGFPSPSILLPPRLEEPVKLEEFEEY